MIQSHGHLCHIMPALEDTHLKFMLQQFVHNLGILIALKIDKMNLTRIWKKKTRQILKRRILDIANFLMKI